MRRAWVINLDAEFELAHGPGFNPGAALTRQLRAHAAPVAATLPEGDVWVDDGGDLRGLLGCAWCPTPRALARLREVGARAPDAPAVEVLRRVNARGFAHAIRALEGERVIRDTSDAARHLIGGRWVLHRAFTFTGRGHRPLDGPPGPADLAWIDKGLAIGPVFAAPRLAISLELALHGHLGADGSLERGVVTVQHTEHGQWRRSERATDALSEEERRALFDVFEEVADALRGAGYFGPFGIDALRHAGGFHPLSEINARYSMGYPVGMGGW